MDKIEKIKRKIISCSDEIEGLLFSATEFKNKQDADFAVEAIENAQLVLNNLYLEIEDYIEEME
jgi:hypothetical protein